MEVSSVLGNGYQSVLCLPTTRPIKNSPPITALAALPPPPQTASTSITTLSTGKHGDVRSQPTNASARDSKNHSISYQIRQSAILEVLQSSDLASALSRFGEVLKAQDLNVVLRHFGEQKRWKDLSQLFDWMEQQGKTNSASYSSYINFVRRGSNSIKAIEIYNNIKDETMRRHVSVCNSTLNCLIKSGKIESSLKLYNQMKRAGFVPDIVTYSTLLVGCAKVEGGYVKAMELIQEIKTQGLHMDIIMYGTLLTVCASNNRREEAEKYFDEMKSEGHLPNVFHYSSLLNAYSVDGNYKKADELIHEMRSAGLELNKVILTTLLKVYVKGGLFEKSRKLLDELHALGYAEDERPYCLLIDGLAKSGQLTEAKLVFDEMRQKEVKNDGYSYSIMISALCRSSLIEEANELAHEFEAKYDKYDVVILNSMLCAYCRSGDMKNVMSIMKKMDESGISPDWMTFNILIKYFCKEKLYLLAYRTMEDMHKKGHQPEEGLSIVLINCLSKTGAHSEAFSVYNMLKYSKGTINKDLHERILHSLLAGGLLKDAYVVVKDNAKFISQHAIKKFATSFMNRGNINLVNDVIKSMHSNGYKIDQVIFHMAISRYIQQSEKKELLLHLLQWMPGQGYAVDLSSRNLILENSHLFGRQFVAELLSRHYAVFKRNKSHEEKAK